jgi:hypothetical protein
MAKDAPQGVRLEDLSDAEIERIEGQVFCYGGPNATMTPALLWRASLRRAPPKAQRGGR